MLNGYSLQQCLQFATATGAACVSQYDALSGLLPLEQLQLKIQRGWQKQADGNMMVPPFEVVTNDTAQTVAVIINDCRIDQG
jgi:hypothetical protein